MPQHSPDAPTVRRRTRVALPPPIEPRPSIRTQYGLHDRFVVDGIGWIANADFQGISQRSGGLAEKSYLGLLRFDRNAQPRPREYLLRVAEGFLLEGEISIGRERPSDWPGHRVATRLVFNASRFFRHHGRDVDNRAPLSPSDWLRPSTNASTIEPATLDGNDNIVPETDLRYAAVEATWREALGRYTQSAFSAVTAELCTLMRAGDQLPAVNLFAERQWVSQAEVYWEFSTPAALDRADYWGRAIQASSGRQTRKTVEYDHNSLVFSVKSSRTGLGSTHALSTYAKTPDRVRFEVQYEGDVGRTVRYNGETGLIERLSRIRVHAADQLRKALRVSLEDQSHLAHPRSALLELFSKVYTACDGDDRMAEHVLRLLITSRRLIIPAAEIPDRVREGLAQTPILVRHRERQSDMQSWYRIAPRYLWVLDRLDRAFPARIGDRWTGPIPEHTDES